MSDGTCDGSGYFESWNDDQSDVVITLCTGCEACDSCVAEETGSLAQSGLIRSNPDGDDAAREGV